MASLIVLFLQILSENNKEYYLKYKEIFEKIKNGNKNSHNDWINFLEKTKGLNSIYRMILDLFYKRKFEKIIKNAKPKNKAKAN